MYLKYLSNAEKHLFLELSLHMSNADGCFSDDEKIMIAALCDEMGIPVSYETNGTVDDAMDRLAEIHSMRTKKMILFELGGVIMSDGVFDKKEEMMLCNLSEKASVGDSFAHSAVELVREMFLTYRKIGELVGAGRECL